jgi:hypothetical protein
MTVLVAIKNSGRVEPITRQTREFEFNHWMRRLAPADFDRICDALNQYIDTQGGGEIITSSWIPGADWTGTPFEPIYVAVGEDWEMARFFYGLIVWNVMMNRSETWSFGRYPKNDGDVIGMTYFRIEIPALS